MAWIVQEYQGDVHIVPDTEPGHELGTECFCEPELERFANGALVAHRDECQRIFDTPLTHSRKGPQES